MATKEQRAAARAKCRKNPPPKKPKAGRKKYKRKKQKVGHKKKISKGMTKFNKCVKKRLTNKKNKKVIKKRKKGSTKKKLHLTLIFLPDDPNNGRVAKDDAGNLYDLHKYGAVKRSTRKPTKKEKKIDLK